MPCSITGDMSGDCHKSYPECGNYEMKNPDGSGKGWIADGICAPSVSRGNKNQGG